MKKNIIYIITIIVLIGGGLLLKNNFSTQKDIINIEDITKTETKTVTEEKEKTELLFNSIKAEEFKNKIDSGEYILVDIRTPKEFEIERIPKTDLNLDYYAKDFKEQVDKLDKTKKYLYYCRSGHRSGLAKKYAKELGFTEVHELLGGINDWKENEFLTTLITEN